MKKCRIIIAIGLLLVILATPALAYEELAKGSKGDEFVALQERLNELGYNVGSADGDFGKKTYYAVVEFQISNKLEISGIADVTTQSVLFGSDAKKIGFKDSKKDIIYELDAVVGEHIEGITRSGFSEDYITAVVGRENITFFVEIGTDTPAWLATNTTSNWREICSILYSYSEAFDGYTYVNEVSGDVITYKTTKNHWNNEPLTEDMYNKAEIGEFLKSISQKTEPYLQKRTDDEPVATAKPTVQPTSSPSSSSSVDWKAVGDAMRAIDTNGDGYLSMDEIFE